MKKRYAFMLFIAISILLLIGYNRYFYSFQALNNNAVIFSGPTKSPNGEYNASAYYIPYGGAAGGVLYIVEVEETQTGKKKTIYSSNHKDIFSMNWKSAEVLKIKNESPEYNDHRNIELNVKSDIYEESGAACRSLLLIGKFENCYKADDIQVPFILKMIGF